MLSFLGLSLLLVLDSNRFFLVVNSLPSVIDDVINR